MQLISFMRTHTTVMEYRYIIFCIYIIKGNPCNLMGITNTPHQLNRFNIYVYTHIFNFLHKPKVPVLYSEP